MFWFNNILFFFYPTLVLLPIDTPTKCSYKILNPKGCEGVADLIQVAKNLLESTGLDPENYRIGNTKACPY